VIGPREHCEKGAGEEHVLAVFGWTLEPFLPTRAVRNIKRASAEVARGHAEGLTKLTRRALE
jgi:hypothetical protein